MFGEMQHQIVAPGAQLGEDAPFGPDSRHRPHVFPRAVDAVHPADGGMPGQHRRRIGVHERIDPGLGRPALEGGKHRRGQKNVAMVAQLDDEHAAQRLERNGILDHGSGR